MRLDTIARISVEYTSTEHEDARTVMIHKRTGRTYVEKGQ